MLPTVLAFTWCADGPPPHAASQPLLLCELEENGTVAYPERRLRELFRHVSNIASGGDAGTTAGGAAVAPRGSALGSRDLRRLSMPFSPANQPMVMARQFVVLINFDPLRAVVLTNKLIVLVPDGADSILSELQSRLFGQCLSVFVGVCVGGGLCPLPPPPHTHSCA